MINPNPGRLFREKNLFHVRNLEIWRKIYEILVRNLNRSPSPDEMQDAWEDFLGQEFQE